MGLINALPPKFLKNVPPYFFHGAFAPSFTWSRRPWLQSPSEVINKQVYRRRYESRRLSKAKLHEKQKKIKYGEKRFSIWRMEFLHRTMWHDHDIGFARWLHPAMWHVALKSWQWIHQVAAPCNVIRGSGMTCHWIRPNVHHIGILHLVSISTTSPQSTCHSAPSPKFYPNRTTVGRNKWRHVDFQDGGSQPSWILRIQ